MDARQFITLDHPIPPDIFKLAVEEAYNQIIITDIDGVVVYANKGLERITGFKTEEVIGKKPNVWGNMMDPAFYKKLWKCIKEDKQPFHGNVTNKRKNGSIYNAMLTVTPILDHLNNLVGYIGTEEEIANDYFQTRPTSTSKA